MYDSHHLELKMKSVQYGKLTKLMFGLMFGKEFYFPKYELCLVIISNYCSYKSESKFSHI